MEGPVHSVTRHSSWQGLCGCGPTGPGSLFDRQGRAAAHSRPAELASRSCLTPRGGDQLSCGRHDLSKRRPVRAAFLYVYARNSALHVANTQ